MYAVVGYVTTKVILPAAMRAMRKRAKRKARGAVDGAAGAVKRNPARASVAAGATVGALGWLAAKRRGQGGSDAARDIDEAVAEWTSDAARERGTRGD
jgi:hypothetical protein